MTQHSDNPYPVDSTYYGCCNAIGQHGPDCSPVQLDPPDPAITRWQELADRDIVVEHDSDAEKVIPFPRPAWADPEEDIIGNRLSSSYYTSAWVRIPMSYRDGEVYGDFFEPATMQVRAKQCGDGEKIIGISARQIAKGEWHWWHGIGMTTAEATALAEALLAAVDLIGGTE